MNKETQSKIANDKIQKGTPSAVAGSSFSATPKKSIKIAYVVPKGLDRLKWC